MALRKFRIFSREQRSLFSDILDWMLTPLLILWPFSLTLTWLVAQSVSDRPFDRALELNVQVISQFVSVLPNPGTAPGAAPGPAPGPGLGSGFRTQLNFPAPAREMLRADESDTVYYQLLGARGEFVVGERDFPLPVDDEKIELGVVKLRDDVLRGEEIRVAYMWVKLGPASAKPILIQVGETREKRATLATEIIKGVLVPQFITMPLAVLLVWFALVRGIRPLALLERRIRARDPDDLSPIDEREVPIEVAPLVSSVNELLRRQKDAARNQKRFLADAAHQLKTPLAGLRMQAELALRADHSTDDLKHSLRQMARASTRATHVVNQLLSLARSELAGDAVKRETVDLVRLVSDAVRDSVPRAMDKRIDLGFDRAEEVGIANVQGNPTLLAEFVRNLIDNALAYTPSGGVVTARVLRLEPNGASEVHVEDTGPGISLAHRDLVFEPFYRVLGTEADGSGLGLSIVREIVRLHGANISIETAHPQSAEAAQGTRFVVKFQAPTSATDLRDHTAA